MSALAIWPCPHWTARICETPPLASVFVGRGADVLVAREVAASQIQNTGVAVLVFTDLADPLSQLARRLALQIEARLRARNAFSSSPPGSTPPAGCPSGPV